MESSARPERKTIEKNRRIYMKALYSQLEGTTEAALTLPEKLDKAIDYIKEKQGKLENMRKRKRHLSGASGREEASGSGEYLPKIEVQELRTNLNSGLRVVIVSSPWEHQEVFWEAIRVMEVEGFEATEFRTGVEAGRVLEKLQKAILQV
ncbi:hypothetical protein ZIOFF_051390 [Zingiber officinale]|uniref:BHLH domain-containing protein n=1 Tax=Zingiber officinale TaxID=94328 RepID=A0A8J5FLV5_ZINOF|nr:hypothetical protein ZIOFF_051390 [Zingiber officinale]